MTNEEFVEKRINEEKKEKFKKNLEIIKELVGENNFKKLGKRIAINTNSGSSSYGEVFYEVNLENGKIEENTTVCHVGEVLLPNRTFNKYFFDYCLKNKIF